MKKRELEKALDAAVSDRNHAQALLENELLLREAREQEAARYQRDMAQYGRQPGPEQGMVSFVGGPLNLTQRKLTAAELEKQRYRVAVAGVPEVFADPASSAAVGVFMGEYYLIRVPLNFRFPYYVGLWEGAR